MAAQIRTANSSCGYAPTEAKGTECEWNAHDFDISRVFCSGWEVERTLESEMLAITWGQDPRKS